jgi:hypothetical protein
VVKLLLFRRTMRQITMTKRNCEVVEVPDMSDVLGCPCGKFAATQCTDCGTAICDTHGETCDICDRPFCLFCLSFHRAVHGMAAASQQTKSNIALMQSVNAPREMSFLTHFQPAGNNAESCR